MPKLVARAPIPPQWKTVHSADRARAETYDIPRFQFKGGVFPSLAAARRAIQLGRVEIVEVAADEDGRLVLIDGSDNRYPFKLINIPSEKPPSGSSAHFFPQHFQFDTDSLYD